MFAAKVIEREIADPDTRITAIRFMLVVGFAVFVFVMAVVLPRWEQKPGGYAHHEQ